MQTLESITTILSECEIKYCDYTLTPRVMKKGDGFLIQLRGTIPDNKTGELTLQSGGKYYISSHAMDDEVVLTVFKAYKQYVLHEAMENFRYNGYVIFNPHTPVRALVNLARITQEVKRP